MAVIRDALGMKVEEFADEFSCGVSMVKHIEAARKALPKRLADKILAKTGVAPEILFKTKITKAEGDQLRSSIALSKIPVGDGLAARALGFVPRLMALYVLTAKSGRHPHVGLRAVDREIGRMINELGLSTVEFEHLQRDFLTRILSPLPNQVGSIYNVLYSQVSDSEGARILEDARIKWMTANPPSSEELAEFGDLIEARNKLGSRGV